MLSQLVSPSVLHFIHAYGYLAVGLGIGIESIGIPVPGESILVAAAIYAGSGHLSILWVIIWCAVGAIIGDNIGYLIGKYGGLKLVTKYGRYIRIYPKHLEHAEKYFKKHGGKTVFFGRFIAFLRIWAAFLAGVNKMEWQTFLFYNAAGGIFWTLFYGLLGYTLGKNLPLLSSVLHTVGFIGLFIFAVIFVAVFMAWKRILRSIES